MKIELPHRQRFGEACGRLERAVNAGLGMFISPMKIDLKAQQLCWRAGGDLMVDMRLDGLSLKTLRVAKKCTS